MLISMIAEKSLIAIKKGNGMIAFLTGFVAAGVILYAAYLARYGRKKVSANDIEVQRIKSNSPEFPNSCPETIYPWHNAPDWAVCAATDKSRKAFWYGYDAQISGQFEEWVLVIFKQENAYRHVDNFTLPPHINWRDSKEMRP